MSSQNNAGYRAYVGKVGDDLVKTILAGLEFIDWGSLINKRSRVFVKPNFTFPRYQEGITTTPELLRSLLALLKGKADTVTVGESDGGNHSFTADEAFEGHGMQQICQETGVELVNLSRLPSEIVTGEVQGKRVRVKLPRLLLEEVDCLISVPVLKVHVMTGVSLSIKNLWGCHPDTMRCLEHQNLGHKLALITKTLKPKIVVVDGLYGLDGHGPLFGVARKADLIIVADNPVAADSLGAGIMGIPIRKANHILLAEQEVLGSTNLPEVTISQSWEKFRMQFNIHKTLIDRATRLLFNSDAIARLVMNSPFSRIIYKVAAALRTSKEKELASQMGKQKTVIGPY